jgi:phospholipid-transporting ATPase
MTDNFINLVSQANPATSQYRPTLSTPNAHSPYGPHSTMDPFFDDDDDNGAPMPDSAYALPMHSQDSGLPLRERAVPPAGSGGDGLPHGWNFDDEEVQVPGQGGAFRGSAAFPGVMPASAEKKKKSAASKGKSRWKWPWQKERVMIGERVVPLNDPSLNLDYCSNFVSTSKYNMLSFTPKFLYGASLCPPLFFSQCGG